MKRSVRFCAFTRVGRDFENYSGHDIPVVGEFTVHVRYNAQEADLPVIINKGDCVVLMGRDWPSTLRLNRKEVSQVYQTNTTVI